MNAATNISTNGSGHAERETALQFVGALVKQAGGDKGKLAGAAVGTARRGVRPKIGYLFTGNASVAVIGYYLLMFPGILLHELSHYVTARILGIKVTDFSLGPRRRKNSNTIELGSVSVYSGGTIRDSLVGIAPFAAGTAVLLLVSYMVFDVGALGRAWVSQGWSGFFVTAVTLPETPDDP